MGKTYLTREDIRMRLNRTIVSYQGDYYTVDVDAPVNEWHQITLRPLGGDNTRRNRSVTVNHSEVDASTPRLGYFNFNNSAYYISRVPERRQNEGFRPESATVLPRMPVGGWVTSNSFREMLHGNYPTIDEALQELKTKETDKLAINYDIAIGWLDSRMTLGIFFKERLIGHYDEKQDRYLLFDSKEKSLITRLLSKTGVFHGKVVA
ncbi:MAG: hypothetical protein GF334_09180 [Candidatus Altiarchaeales archaeon]|nr:hypothetical protein [Candidatus Altiarchaeales archaeon]